MLANGHNQDGDRMKNLAIGFILGLIMAGAVCAYTTLKRVTTPSILAQPAKELKHEKPETLACKPVIVYRDRIKKDLGLPETIVKATTKKVTASTKVPASDFPNTVTSVYDSGTGATDMFIRQDKTPWLGFARKGTLGLAYGVQDDGEATTRLSASYSLLSVKRLNLGLTGDIATSGRAFIGVGATIGF